MVSSLSKEARVRMMLNVLGEVRPTKAARGRTVDSKGTRLLRLALKLWPYKVQEFDRIAVELFDVPPLALAKVRGVNHISLGVYDKRVKNRYLHLKKDLVAMEPAA